MNVTIAVQSHRLTRMPKCQIQLNGQNFLVDVGKKSAKHGFITFRNVESPDTSTAELSAVEMLRQSAQLRDLIQNDPNDPPVIDVMEMIEVDSFNPDVQSAGFLWYEEQPKRWWRFWE